MPAPNGRFGGVVFAALDYEQIADTRKVSSRRLDFVNRAGTSNEILRDVLGLEYTSPNWVGDRVRQMVQKLASGPMDESSLAGFRSELESLGLAEYFPAALAQALDQR